MVLQGGFRDLPERPVERLDYWRLAGGPDPGEVRSVREGRFRIDLAADLEDATCERDHEHVRRELLGFRRDEQSSLTRLQAARR